MNKILIEIICAATGISYDFWIPKKMPLNKVFEKITADICEYEGDAFLFPNAAGLTFYHKTQRIFINTAQTAVEAGIKGGDSILII